jgi:hypothetical protein
MFDPKSRYAGLAQLTYGGSSRYVSRRVVPQPPSTAGATHTVLQGERLDTIAAQALADPLQFWRICDVNATIRPTDLTASPGDAIVMPTTAG